jgi:hypothetical protein
MNETITIIIKNVTGTNDNDWKIWELQRASFPEGSIVKDVEPNKSGTSFSWSSSGYNCVAFLGQTCELYEPKTEKK